MSHATQIFNSSTTMAFPTVHSDLLGPHPVPIINSKIPGIFATIGVEDQRGLVSQLENFIEEVNADGSTVHMLRLGVLNEDNMDEKDFKKDHVLEKCNWQLAQFYRVG
jgi:hypothetical protein